MEKRKLGKSNIEVSRLCYGTLSFASSQANLTPSQGGELLIHAAQQGVTFVDTAELYGTYSHIRHALKHSSIPLVISTKSYAYDKESARLSVEKARREMDVDVIDLFMLHEQENIMTMLGHQEALDYYLSMKEKGIIRAVGISTHAIEPVQAVVQAKTNSSQNTHTNAHSNTHSYSNANIHSNTQSDTNSNTDIYQYPIQNWKNHWSEFDPGRYREIDVIHPILNIKGIGLLDGDAKQMRDAVEAAHSLGVGIFGMKMLGGGNLFNEFDQAVSYALSFDAADSYAVGMQSKEEIDMNVALFEGREVSDELMQKTKARKRRLLIEDWCTGCGKCAQECKAGALRIFNGRAHLDASKCVLCSYCARACRDFAIKVV